MKILGIIAEYNPFHYGHLYHLKKAVEITQPDYTIAVMSGNFTQRGEAAILDKWIRAEAAVRCGIDLVLELPAVYAVQTAEIFAYGGIQLLNHTGLVTHVCFGSETGSLEPLMKIADILAEEDPEYKQLLKNHLLKGLSFPEARYHAVMDYIKSRNPRDEAEYNSPDVHKALISSNSILGIEYLKALSKTNSTIAPVTIPRIRSSYLSQRIKKGIASATAIRKEIFQNGMNDKVHGAVPEAVFQIMSDAFDRGMGPVDNQVLQDIILGIIRRSSPAEIAAWMDVGGGLENRLKEKAQEASGLNELLSLVKTRRYVNTRLQRILIHGLLNLTSSAFNELNDETGPQYLRILAFSKNAAPLLKKLKETAKVPVITKAAHISRYSDKVQKMFAYDRMATDLYSLGIKNQNMRRGDRDYTQGAIML